MKLVYLCLFMLLLFGCGSAEKEMICSYDLNPPVLLSAEVFDSNELVLRFDEDIVLEEESMIPEESLLISGYQIEESRLSLKFEKAMNPGQKYKCSFSVLDRKKNGMSFNVVFYGFNPEKPKLVINEYNPRGSDSSPDCIEIFVIEGGLMGGCTLTLGSLAKNDGRYIFPNFRVSAGDYIILHCKPEGIDIECDELTEKNLSQGKLSHPDAWDFWWDEAPGLPGNNGIICLWSTPEGESQDQVFYTDRVSIPEDRYLGWTSSVYSLLESFHGDFNWSHSAEIITPDDCIPVGSSTATRSVCRRENSSDTDSRDDWHIVPTGQKSFGYKNSNEVY